MANTLSFPSFELRQKQALSHQSLISSCCSW